MILAERFYTLSGSVEPIDTIDQSTYALKAVINWCLERMEGRPREPLLSFQFQEFKYPFLPDAAPQDYKYLSVHWLMGLNQ